MCKAGDKMYIGNDSVYDTSFNDRPRSFDFEINSNIAIGTQFVYDDYIYYGLDNTMYAHQFRRSAPSSSLCNGLTVDLI